MATIYNSDLTKELVQGAKIQQATDRIPSQLGDVVIPVMEVNPKLLRRVNVIKVAAAINATSSTVYTTPTDKDFYLTAGSLSVVKDATATSVASTLTATTDFDTGVSILRIATLTLTVQNDTQTQSWIPPILLKRGTNITVTNSTATGNVTAVACIQGYTVENVNA